MSVTRIPARLRRLVYARARGCCEYCLIAEAHTLLAHQVDHVIAEKHGGLTSAENLALSCQQCNSHKGSDIASLDPETGDLTPLFNPREAGWDEVFALAEGVIVTWTASGRATIALLRLNEPERVEERRVLQVPGVLRS